jgi:hypothetical protein
MEVSSELDAPAALPPGKNTGTHWIESWVNPRAILDGLWRRENPLLLPGFEPLTIQPVRSRYTHYTIPVLLLTPGFCKIKIKPFYSSRFPQITARYVPYYTK